MNEKQDDSQPDSQIDSQTDNSTPKGDRIAKVLARAGVASRREAEKMITERRVSVNGKIINSPALNVLPRAKILLDGNPIAAPDPPRVWRYHKKRGLVTTERDPQGRPTVFEAMPSALPRLVSIGRLDINTEGLLLMTNDGGLKRYLELPETGWLRRYRVRAYGQPNMQKLEEIKKGVVIDRVVYRSVDLEIERHQGDNFWLAVSLREGKNREIKKLLEYAGLQVNRLIRLSFGPFQLGSLGAGEVEEVQRRILRQQLGSAWADIAEGREPKRVKPRLQKAGKSEASSKSGPKSPYKRQGKPASKNPRDTRDAQKTEAKKVSDNPHDSAPSPWKMGTKKLATKKLATKKFGTKK